jgi:hypothetical protein
MLLVGRAFQTGLLPRLRHFRPMIWTAPEIKALPAYDWTAPEIKALPAYDLSIGGSPHEQSAFYPRI